MTWLTLLPKFYQIFIFTEYFRDVIDRNLRLDINYLSRLQCHSSLQGWDTPRIKINRLISYTLGSVCINYRLNVMAFICMFNQWKNKTLNYTPHISYTDVQWILVVFSNRHIEKIYKFSATLRCKLYHTWTWTSLSVNLAVCSIWRLKSDLTSNGFTCNFYTRGGFISKEARPLSNRIILSRLYFYED